jgi:hypothetical protein
VERENIFQDKNFWDLQTLLAVKTKVIEKFTRHYFFNGFDANQIRGFLLITHYLREIPA